MISPRTRRKIALLPPPTEDDMGKIEAVEKDARAEQVGHLWPVVGVVMGCRLLRSVDDTNGRSDRLLDHL